MDNPLYEYQPISERPKLEFPNGARLAFYVGLNIEHFRFNLPVSGGKSIPDPQKMGARDYGTRVGIWRMMELFDEIGLRASAITNSDVCLEYPQIVKAGVERGWAWIAHGQTNSIREAEMTIEEEKVFLGDMMAVFDDSLPSRPKGWLGPGLSETFATPQLLRDFGFNYLLDWCADDQPFPLTIPGMISVPYSLGVNDASLMNGGTHTGSQYEEIVMDQFEVLLEESKKTGLVMALPIHTYLVGQPARFKYLARILRTICSTEGVWVCTSDDIANHYLSLIGS